MGDPLTSRLTLTAATPSLSVPGFSSYEYRDAVAYELDLVFENVSTTIRGTGDVLLRNSSSSTDMLIKLKEVRFGEFFFEPEDFIDGYMSFQRTAVAPRFPISVSRTWRSFWRRRIRFQNTPDPFFLCLGRGFEAIFGSVGSNTSTSRKLSV